MLASDQVASYVAGRIINNTAAGAHVQADRAWPWNDSELPAWRVSVGSESITATWLDGKTVEADIEVDAEATVKTLTGIDQAMGAIVAQALPAIFTNPVPFGIQLTGIDRELQQTAESTLGQITVHLSAHIAYRVDAPETLISTP